MESTFKVSVSKNRHNPSLFTSEHQLKSNGHTNQENMIKKGKTGWGITLSYPKSKLQYNKNKSADAHE